MLKRYPLKALLAVLFVSVLSYSGAALAGHSGRKISTTKVKGPYSITLKLLPAEPFVSRGQAGKPSSRGEMVKAGGAHPVGKRSAQNPNYHLVAFIKKAGRPLEHADVEIHYKREASTRSKERKLPVTRMWIAGKGRKTTHYGNNVRLKPGTYDVKVQVNNKVEAHFHIDIG